MQKPSSETGSENAMESNGSGSNSSINHPHNYKTSLCHQWLTNGQCPRGSACNYAHGTVEIRPRYGEAPATLFKSSLCKFYQGGKCGNGDQCNYAHGPVELRTKDQQLPTSSDHFLFTPAATMQTAPAPTFHPNTNMFLPFQQVAPPFLPRMTPTMTMPPPMQVPPSPYLMSNPAPMPMPPNPFLWGQPPPQNAPTSLNSLLKPEHFQPLTSSMPPHQQHVNVARTALHPPITPAFLHHPPQFEVPTQNGTGTANFPAPTQMLKTEKGMPQMLFKPFDHRPTPSITTMAQIAQQFETQTFGMTTVKDDKGSSNNKCFNANDDDDFPSLGSTTVKTKQQQPAKVTQKMPAEKSRAPESVVEAKKITTNKSFANIAAKTPAGFAITDKPKVPTIVKQSSNSNVLCVQQKKQSKKRVEIIGPKFPAADEEHPAPNEMHNMPMPPSVEEELAFSTYYSNPPTPLLPPNNSEPRDVFDDLFDKAPMLNHYNLLNQEMYETIKGGIEEEERQEEAWVEEMKPNTDAEKPPEDEWQMVVSARRRKSSITAEHLAHRPSPCTDDDGYQEGFSSESPASTQQSEGGGNPGTSGGGGGAGGGAGANNHLDKSHIFYRTYLCIFWQNHRDGKGPPCKHGERCFYAHGEKKLIKLNPIYYKTTLCEAYNTDQQCPYGGACNFAHGEKELRKPSFNGVLKGQQQKKFFSVPHRHQLRKQRGTQTVHCTPAKGQYIEKVTVVKADAYPNNVKK